LSNGEYDTVFGYEASTLSDIDAFVVDISYQTRSTVTAFDGFQKTTVIVAIRKQTCFGAICFETINLIVSTIGRTIRGVSPGGKIPCEVVVCSIIVTSRDQIGID
jgi:hypothetical protein